MNQAERAKYRVWAEYDPWTLRCTGRWHWQSDDSDQPDQHWLALDPDQAMPYISNSWHWNELAVIRGQPRRLPTNVDLKFLTHISSDTWPEITMIDPEWTAVPWVPLQDTRIEPDDWDLFWHLWRRHEDEVGYRGTKTYWRGLNCWLDPRIKAEQLSVGGGNYQDWSSHFPRMFDQIRSVMPWHTIERVVLWQNTKPVDPHFDPNSMIFPWPDSFRVMLWDSNSQPTFWMTPWPSRADTGTDMIWDRRTYRLGVGPENEHLTRRRIYVDLPSDSNTFVFNNGAWMHGADRISDKILLAVHGRPKIAQWLASLRPSLERHRSRIFQQDLLS